MTNHEPKQPHQPTMLSFARDLPNICSLAGLLCAVLGIYYAILGIFPLAIIGVLWAVLFDWADGIIARQMTGRTDHHRAFGGQLDSLIDIVSFGVFPAVFLLSYGKFSLWFMPGAFLVVAVSAIRLSYFNIFGLIDDKTYMGMALDNNVIIFAFVFLFEGFFNHTVFSIILYALWMVFLVFNLAPVRTPKFADKWFYVLIIYTLVLTVIYGWMQWNRA
ncbi:MAG: CDP-diacylglycerol---serine O-phosphatidyltransferase [Desulfobacteraceae bacterium Eth-SRB1]|nr:MAG: CDP-diacylglycerol---serine O-phosphatidyltransferase [Desulfobacteraceae bacterium Eth-SRB1]